MNDNNKSYTWKFNELGVNGDKKGITKLLVSLQKLKNIYILSYDIELGKVYKFDI